jgi:excisionase family DNA binding protein
MPESLSPVVAGVPFAYRQFRPDEAAEVLGLSRAQLFKLLNAEAIRSYKVGRARLIPGAALEEFVAERMGGAA